MTGRKQLDAHIDPTGMHTLKAIAKADRFNAWTYDVIRPFLKGNVLEIGSGIGNISRFAVADGHSITLSDYNEEYVDLLRKTFSGTKNVTGILKIDLLHTDFTNKYSDLKEQFDCIFLLNVIEHLPDDMQAVRNCDWLLKPGGHLVILAPAYQWLYCKLDKQLGHFRRYTTAQIQTLLVKNGFTIGMKRYFNFAGILGWLFSGKILRRKRLSGGEMTAFNSIVPLAKLSDNLILKKAGLSVIVAGIKTS